MVGAGPATAHGTDRPPATANDGERQAFERLGAAEWWRWVRRGQFDPMKSWETDE